MKKKIFIPIIIIALIILFLTLRVLFLKAYTSVEDKQLENFFTVYQNKETYNIIKEESSKEKLIFQELTMENAFKDCEKKPVGNLTNSEMYFDKENNLVGRIGVDNTYISLLKEESTTFGEGTPFFDRLDHKKILKELNITNDLKLFDYLYQTKGKKYNIFTSIKTLKQQYMIRYFASIALPKLNKLTILDGKQKGYILEIDTKFKYVECSLIKQDKRYIVSFIGNSWTKDTINHTLNTIEIK